MRLVLIKLFHHKSPHTIILIYYKKSNPCSGRRPRRPINPQTNSPLNHPRRPMNQPTVTPLTNPNDKSTDKFTTQPPTATRTKSTHTGEQKICTRSPKDVDHYKITMCPVGVDVHGDPVHPTHLAKCTKSNLVFLLRYFNNLLK